MDFLIRKKSAKDGQGGLPDKPNSQNMVIDTNILIACLNGEPQTASALSEWKQNGRPLFISSITYAEVLSIASLTATEITTIKAFLQNFILVPVDAVIAERAGDLRRKHRLELPDAMIAATAIILSLPLITHDRALQKLKEIEFLAL